MEGRELTTPRKGSAELFEIRPAEANLLFLVREIEKAVASSTVNWSPGLANGVRARLLAVAAKVPDAAILGLAAD
jgi:hypothetical protein